MKTWILVADAARARFFNAERDDLNEIEDFVHPESRRHAAETASDEPGSTFDRVGEGRHGMGQAVDPKSQEAIRFAKEIGERLESARQAGDYERLHLVAAPAFLGLLREAMSPPVRELVGSELDKDLVTHSVREIREHLPQRL